MPELADAQRTRWMNRVVKRWEAPLLAYARRFVGEPEARDVVQETFVSLWRGAPAAEVEDLRGYVYSSCRNRCIDLLRSQRGLALAELGGVAELVPPGFAPRAGVDPAEHVAARQELAQVLARIVQLPAREQEVLRLKLVDGLTYAEIGEVMGLPAGTVGWVIHEALAVVRGGRS